MGCCADATPAPCSGARCTTAVAMDHALGTILIILVKREITMSIAVFGGGCFWCTEAVFRRLEGVTQVVPGYCGGQSEAPTYEEVCSGHSGHVEVIQIRYDEQRISFETLLDVFFATHDPTTRDRQGNDVGPQYRSVIFAQNDGQAQQAREKIATLDA